MAILNIGGININNHHKIKEIAGIAGFAKSVRYTSECEAFIDIRNNDFWNKAGIKESEIEKMLGRFVINGFYLSIAA